VTWAQASVVIVNYNGLQHLQRCLPAVTAQRYPNYEVLVVDNASSDGSADYVAQAFPQVRLIRNHANLGYAAGNNVGFQHATGEYLAVLNPDTEPTPDWLGELVGALAAPLAPARLGLATSKILLMDDPAHINACGNELTLTGLTFCRGLGQPAERYAAREAVAAVSGAAFVVRREVLEQLGGFDERFYMYYEDTDLSLRAMLAGYTCLYVPTSVVCHQYAFRFSPRKCFYQERNRHLMLVKTLRWRTLLVLLPTLLFAEVIVWGYVLRMGPRHVFSKLRAHVWLIGHMRLILEARARTQTLRQVGDRAILERMGQNLSLTQTSSPRLAAALEGLLNPLLHGLGQLSLRIVTW
jgi:GT2 family glycosyltransferase